MCKVLNGDPEWGWMGILHGAEWGSWTGRTGTLNGEHEYMTFLPLRDFWRKFTELNKHRLNRFQSYHAFSFYVVGVYNLRFKSTQNQGMAQIHVKFTNQLCNLCKMFRFFFVSDAFPACGQNLAVASFSKVGGGEADVQKNWPFQKERVKVQNSEPFCLKFSKIISF